VAGRPRNLLRTTFEQLAELYDRARPTYPPQIFDDLGVIAQLSLSARVLEIGCGTGQGTLPLAQRGYAVTCVELGQQLAAVAQRNLASFPTPFAGDMEVHIGADAAVGDIGQRARAEIEALLGHAVFFELYVKVEPRWRRDEALSAQLGF
jgi:predicted O-methyltransferase YrrM